MIKNTGPDSNASSTKTYIRTFSKLFKFFGPVSTFTNVGIMTVLMLIKSEDASKYQHNTGCTPNA